jgi:hypothetical protein
MMAYQQQLQPCGALTTSLSQRYLALTAAPSGAMLVNRSGLSQRWLQVALPCRRCRALLAAGAAGGVMHRAAHHACHMLCSHQLTGDHCETGSSQACGPGCAVATSQSTLLSRGVSHRCTCRLPVCLLLQCSSQQDMTGRQLPSCCLSSPSLIGTAPLGTHAQHSAPRTCQVALGTLPTCHSARH